MTVHQLDFTKSQSQLSFSFQILDRNKSTVNRLLKALYVNSESTSQTLLIGSLKSGKSTILKHLISTDKDFRYISGLEEKASQKIENLLMQISSTKSIAKQNKKNVLIIDDIDRLLAQKDKTEKSIDAIKEVIDISDALNLNILFSATIPEFATISKDLNSRLRTFHEEFVIY